MERADRRPAVEASVRDSSASGVELSAELHRARVALDASEERYRALYENIPLMYFTLAVDGTVLAVNVYGAEQLGYRPKELIGELVLKVFHPEDRRAVGDRLQGALAEPGQVASWRFRKIRKDGSMLWVREAVRVVEKNGLPIVLVVCEDVTEQVEAEAELGRYRDQLRALSAELTLTEARECRRIAEGFHDHTGQALVAARMRLGALHEAEPDAGKRRALDEVRKLLEQTLRQTRSLTFELSCPVLYRLGLAAALRDLGEGLEQENGVRFQFEGDPGPAPLADDQRVLIYRAVRELLSNRRRVDPVRDPGRADRDRIGLSLTPISDFFRWRPAPQGSMIGGGSAPRV